MRISIPFLILISSFSIYGAEKEEEKPYSEAWSKAFDLWIEACSSATPENVNKIKFPPGRGESDAWEETILVVAARNPNPKTLDAIIGKRIKNREPSDYSTNVLVDHMLFRAVHNPNPEVLKLIVSWGVVVKDPEEDPESLVRKPSLLREASSNPNEKIMELLIAQGLKVDRFDALDRTALCLAAMRNSNPKVLQVLIDAGANINHLDYDRNNLLMLASGNNPNVEIIPFLLKLGFKINEAKDFYRPKGPIYAMELRREKGGRTPLHCAAESNPNPLMLKELIKAGAEIDARERLLGLTPLMLATKDKKPSIEKVKILLDAGAEVNIRDTLGGGSTALDWVYDSKEIKDLLISKGAKSSEDLK